MQSRSFQMIQMVSIPVLMLGGVLLFFNILTGHHLYHVNTIKLFTLGCFVCFLWVYSALFPPSQERQHISWQVGLLLCLLTLGMLPGSWLNPEDNVYYPIELVTDMLVVAWVVVVMRMLDSAKSCAALLTWFALILVIIAIQTAKEAFGFHPSTGELIILTRPDASFGNVNYLAGFLAVLCPVFVLLSLPEHTDKWRWSLHQKLSTAGLAALVFSLALTQTRAAMAAAIFSTMGALCLTALVSDVRQIRRAAIGLVIAGIAIVAFIATLPFISPGVLESYPGRLAQLYDLSHWWTRIVPIRGAADSIMASPIVGWGLGSSYNLNFSFLPLDSDLYIPNSSYNHLHNELFELAQEGGLFGMALWLTTFVVIGIFLIRFAAKTQDHFSRFLAIGIVGAIVAFYTHGIFSVAQRMIVANLPLYTLIAMGGVLIAESRKNQPWFNVKGFIQKNAWLQPAAKYVRVWQFALLWLIVMWVVFYPWIVSFYGMVKHNETQAGVEERREFFRKWPNPYGLSSLMNTQAGKNQIPQALETAKQLNDIIPHYRQLPYRKAALYLSQGNIDKAYEQAKLQHSLSTYHPSSNSIILAVALRNNNREEFVRHMKFLLVHSVIYARLENKYRSPGHIVWSNESGMFNAQEVDGKLVINLNDEFINGWFDNLNNNDELKKFVDRKYTELLSSDFVFPVKPGDRRNFTLLLNKYVDIDRSFDKKLEEQMSFYQRTGGYRNKTGKQIKVDQQRIKGKIEEEKHKKKERYKKAFDEALRGSGVTTEEYLQRFELANNITRALLDIFNQYSRISARK